MYRLLIVDDEEDIRRGPNWDLKWQDRQETARKQ